MIIWDLNSSYPSDKKSIDFCRSLNNIFVSFVVILISLITIGDSAAPLFVLAAEFLLAIAGFSKYIENFVFEVSIIVYFLIIKKKIYN